MNKPKNVFLWLLKLNKTVFGEIHPETARSYRNLGGLYNETKEYSISEDYWLKALEIQKKVFGDHHKETADLCCEIGNFYYNSAQYEKAHKYYLTTFEIYRAKVSPDSNKPAKLFNVGLEGCILLQEEIRNLTAAEK